ncbi:MAG: transposase [Desulfobulbaceae bacterium]|nr:transposase [Desulfobulbaceae bacterium]
MPRAHRHYIPGCVWHITHRCHKQEFLLKFNKDRRRWRHWLFEAKKRYGLCVLNYIATSNHTHMLVVDTGEETIPRSLQLIAGRTAQEYNIRKKRKGAFWEDRYHATAVQTDQHLVKCLIYIDLNMVRAGVVRHPSQYSISGYNEIQNPSERYSVVDRKTLRELFTISDESLFQETHREWVKTELANDCARRNSLWSESIAVGDKSFIKDIQEKLASRAQGRSVLSHNGTNTLKEPEVPYGGQKNGVSSQNTYFLPIYT